MSGQIFVGVVNTGVDNGNNSIAVFTCLNPVFVLNTGGSSLIGSGAV